MPNWEASSSEIGRSFVWSSGVLKPFNLRCGLSRLICSLINVVIAVVVVESLVHSKCVLYIHLLFVNRQHNKENTKIRKEVVNKIAVKYEHYIFSRSLKDECDTNANLRLKTVQLIYACVSNWIGTNQLLGLFTRLSDVPDRSSRRSASSNHLLIPPVCHLTVGLGVFMMSRPTQLQSFMIKSYYSWDKDFLIHSQCIHQTLNNVSAAGYQPEAPRVKRSESSDNNSSI